MICKQCKTRPKYQKSAVCSICLSENRRERYRSDPEFRYRLRSYSSKHRNRLSFEEVEALVEEQGGCALCHTDSPGGKGRWHVDHDHACCPDPPFCGRCVRGILCHNCNTALGRFNDDPAKLVRAANYLMQKRAIPA